MENFDLKKFLVENKLTSNSKMLSEAKSAFVNTSETPTTEGTLPPDWQEKEDEWRMSQERDAFNVFNSKSEAVDNTPIMIDGKEVDEDSVELDSDDFGNGEEYFVDKAKFVDGTELDLDQMQELTDNYIKRFAPDGNKYVGPSR